MDSKRSDSRAIDAIADAPRERTATGRWIPWALVVLGFLVLRGGFVAPFLYDDVGSLVENPSIRDLSDVSAVLSPPRDETVSGRPVLNLSFALDHARAGLDPRAFHVTNLAIHLAAALLLFGLARRTLARERMPAALRAAAPELAGAIAALWMLHPLQTASVTYLVQRASSLMGFFYLATLYSAARAFDAERARGWTLLAVCACLLGVGTKEVTATAPLVVLLYDRAFVSPSLRTALARHRALYAGLAATWLPLAWLVAQAPRSGSAGFGFESVSPLAYFATQPGVLLHYLRLVFLPRPLVFHYDWPLAGGISDVLLPGLVVAALLAASLIAWRRRPALGFLGLGAFSLLAPTSLVPLVTEVAAEQRMYLPLASVLALVVCGAWLGLSRVLEDAWTRGMAGALLLGFALAGVGSLTAQRNRDYESVVSIWSSVIAVDPQDAMAQDSLGLALRRAGEPVQALPHALEAVRLQPSAAGFRLNLGTILLDLQKPQEAEVELARAVELRPDDARAQNAHAVALAQLGRLGEARAGFERALELDPNTLGARENLHALERLGSAGAAPGHD